MFASPDFLTLILPNGIIYNEDNIFRKAVPGLTGNLKKLAQINKDRPVVIVA